MKRTVTAIFDGEVLRPEEPLDLEPHGRYRVTIEVDEKGEEVPGGPPGLLQRIAAYAQELDLPPGFAEQYEHYLYGVPKQ